jgi:hypothetical protein
MADDAGGVVEKLFDCLSARDWDGFRSLLSPSVERIGPMGERVVGREPYVELMAGPEPASDDEGQRTAWDVHRIAYAPDARFAFARVTARVPGPGRELQIEETLAFTIDPDGLVACIEVFWRDPRSNRSR